MCLIALRGYFVQQVAHKSDDVDHERNARFDSGRNCPNQRHHEANRDAQAVSLAAREFLRRTRLQELKQASGKVDFVNNWRLLEADDLDRPLPTN